MSNSFSFEKSKPSNMKRLPLLPRFAVTVDVAGRRMTYRQAPLIETIANMWDRGFSMKNFLDVTFEQLSEIELPKVASFTGAKKPKRKSAKRAQS